MQAGELFWLDRRGAKCEYVLDSHEQATGSTLIIIMFVAALVPLPIINDADEVKPQSILLILTLIITLNSQDK